ncbi:transcriptional regulator, TraR/DksA family [Sulfitobacter marinus]|uniref:Transcriptional regulator, TraR/DksA family n=1 Tax=Sulfitobacter marinus TaxID=394264 RepID=A0A1I6QRT1_9RHOB|nr:TraR/DksA C4-type zinc finger protein [Sulfitobacter marinus]SFS55153.1 transcriptional regulator, TraR/DksA family [Sulfitobacter marinus]
MLDHSHYAGLIKARLQELDARMHEVDHELGTPKSPDMDDQSIDLEDDEVLEGIGIAAQKEIALLRLAMERIKNGSYGVCKKCGGPISDARLTAVLYTPLCKNCAANR